MYEIAIVGAGITGGCIARELSKYVAKVVVLEKESDVADGTTKANSAIIHAGYDPVPGSLMAKYNVWGNRLYPELCKELHADFIQNGSLVLAFEAEDLKHLQELYSRGIENGVPGLKLIEGEEVRRFEPNISEKAIGALYAPSAGIISPWEVTENLFENALDNGVELMLNSEVLSIEKRDEIFFITTSKGVIESRAIVNCAGVNGDLINNMVCEKKIRTIPKKGEYFVMDKNIGDLVKSTIFQCPTLEGKGVLIAPTVHGNLLIGPNSELVSDRENLGNTSKGMEYVKRSATKAVESINFRESIRNFSGLRAEPETNDFIIGKTDVKGFYNVAGIKSPGLTAAPAIALDIVNLIKEFGLIGEKKSQFKSPIKYEFFMRRSLEERKELIEKNPAYGRVICRCETITEGEIVDALNRNLPVLTLEAVKRRCRTGTGRCQGGFCTPKVLEIMARELKKPMEEIEQDRIGSRILMKKS